MLNKQTTTDVGMDKAKEKITKKGKVKSCLSIGDTSYVVVEGTDGVLIGNNNNRDDITIFEVLIPLDRSIAGQNLTEASVVGMDVDVVCAMRGKHPVVAKLVPSILDENSAAASPFAFKKSDLNKARQLSPDGSLSSPEAHDFLEKLGYTDDHLAALNDSAMSDINYQGSVLNIGDAVTHTKTHLRQINEEVTLPTSVVETTKQPPVARLRKKNCYLAPKVFAGK